MVKLRGLGKYWWRRIQSEPRIRFSIRSLLVLMFAVAVGFSVVKAEGTSREMPDLFYSEWGHGALAAVAACFVCGLLNQVRDLATTYRGQKRRVARPVAFGAMRPHGAFAWQSPSSDATLSNNGKLTSCSPGQSNSFTFLLGHPALQRRFTYCSLLSSRACPRSEE
ncbi:MAG TPA: hypothetical protein VFE24_00965 [Pirellulales bacterium]|jgi:hypothetical protein|nr:hypothetical protein [Pirellulales bacterium]